MSWDADKVRGGGFFMVLKCYLVSFKGKEHEVWALSLDDAWDAAVEWFVNDMEIDETGETNKEWVDD